MESMDAITLGKLAKLIRYFILAATSAAGSGHATSSLSAVELMTMLYFKYLTSLDRVIFSKGHATPLLYSIYAAAGKITEEELMKYRTFGSNLEGHPTPRFPYVDAATGSLGQGLSVGVGEALAFRTSLSHFSNLVEETPLEKSVPRVYVLLGDGEMAEGEVWEALSFAAFRKLNNLVAIIDVNRLGQSQETMYDYQMEVYRRKLEAFGWGAIVIDGHNFSEIDAAYQKALDYKIGPVAIIAKTVKGKGVSFLEDKNGWHGKALSKEELAKALAELGEVDKTIRAVIPAADHGALVANENFSPSSEAARNSPLRPVSDRVEAGQNFVGPPQPISIHAPKYDVSKPVATRKAFGQALVRIAPVYPAMVVLDGDVKNSTYTELFEKAYPDRFFESFIAEQNMVGVALGLSKSGFAPWVSTFACFMTRAFDQIRMAAISGATIRFNGSHAGVSIGQDGPSQMGLEDLALFRSINGSTVLYPADPFATEALVEAMMSKDGISYIRTNRPETPVVYTEADTFMIGGSKTFDQTNAIVTVVGAGVTLHEALSAQTDLLKENIPVRVIDCYSVKPIDSETLKKAAMETKAIIVVEDHYPEGGLGEAVKSALSGSPSVPIIHLAVRKMPRSGKPEELLDFEGIDHTAIIDTVRRISSH